MAFDATSLYPSAMYDENSFYPKIESEYVFTPEMNDEIVNEFNTKTFTKSAILNIKDFCDAMMHVLKDSINLKYSELLTKVIRRCNCDAMMHVLKDSINLKYSELLTKVIRRCNLI